VAVCCHDKRWSRFLAAAENLWVVQRSCGECRVLGGQWSQALLRLYAFWELKYQESVNDSYDVWSSFLYIPYSSQCIQHIECRV